MPAIDLKTSYAKLPVAPAASVVLYVLTAFIATGLLDYRLLAQSDSPIAETANAIKIDRGRIFSGLLTSSPSVDILPKPRYAKKIKPAPCRTPDTP